MTPPPPTLRGHFDGVFVAERFVQVRGWVCCLDRTPAEPPLTLTLNGRQFAGFGLNARRDLAAAGIAGGMAFFDAVLPIEDATVEHSYALGITDSLGNVCTLQAVPARVVPFAPVGAIDEAGERLISGWVFDPHHAGGAAHPCLVFDGEFVCRIHPTINRHDLSYDLGGGHKPFGYELLAEVLVPHLARLQRRDPSRVGTLCLASSCLALSCAPVRLENGAPAVGPATPCRPPIRLPASDRLAELLSPIS
jgi:hypothetical protein